MLACCGLASYIFGTPSAAALLLWEMGGKQFMWQHLASNAPGPLSPGPLLPTSPFLRVPPPSKSSLALAGGARTQNASEQLTDGLTLVHLPPCRLCSPAAITTLVSHHCQHLRSNWIARRHHPLSLSHKQPPSRSRSLARPDPLTVRRVFWWCKVAQKRPEPFSRRHHSLVHPLSLIFIFLSLMRRPSSQSQQQSRLLRR